MQRTKEELKKLFSVFRFFALKKFFNDATLYTALPKDGSRRDDFPEAPAVVRQQLKFELKE